MSEQHQYKFDITMSCRGCSGAVDRVLKKLEGEGVTSYEVNLESQSATVNTEPSLSYEKVLETIKKTGKTVKAGEADGISMSV
jgi:copper chaperone